MSIDMVEYSAKGMELIREKVQRMFQTVAELEDTFPGRHFTLDGHLIGSIGEVLRNAVSIGGDSDTIAAIAGGVAEAYYGIPEEIRKHALTFLDGYQLGILNAFESKYGIITDKEMAHGNKVVKYSPKAQVDYQVNKQNEGNREKEMLVAVDNIEVANQSAEDRMTTSDRLMSYLFEACNILRGPIDQDDYKSYVIPILFFKRVSDVYDEETAYYEEQYSICNSEC